jgi:hypothetical protein
LNLDEFLPEQIGVDLAFAAMVRFLAMHCRERGGTAEIADFIRSISSTGTDHPASDEVFNLFKNAVVFADRLEMVDGLGDVR